MYLTTRKRCHTSKAKRGDTTRAGEGQLHGSAIRRTTALHTEHVQCCLEGGKRTSRGWRVRKERNSEEWERKEAKVVVKVVEKDEAVLIARFGTGIVSHDSHMTPNSICMQRKKKARKPETT